MSKIRFKEKISKIGSWNILRLPKSASIKLPSRGMVMVKGNINGYPFHPALEPDGKGSHWLNVDEAMLKGARVKVGDSVTLAIEPT